MISPTERPHGAARCIAGGRPHTGLCIDPAIVAEAVEEIARLKAELEEAFAFRRKLIYGMLAQNMTRKLISDFLGVSNVLVAYVANGGYVVKKEKLRERGKRKVQR